MFGVLKWTMAAMVGLLLGGYILSVASLPRPWPILFVLAALCPFLAMMVGNVQRLLLALVLLDIPFHLDIHLNYQVEAAALGAIGGLGLSVTTVSLVGLYVIWLGKVWLGAEPRPRSALRLSLPLTTYVIIAILSVAVARHVALASFEVFVLLHTFLLYTYVANTVRTRQDVLFIVVVLLVGVVLESLVMIGLGASGQDFSFAGISSRTDATEGIGRQFHRVAGTIGSPNGAAGYLSLLLAPALSLLMTPLGRGYKWLAGLALSLGGLALMFTFSRGGWVSFALSITLLCALAWRRGWLSLSMPLVVLIFAALLALPFQGAIISRLSDVEAAQSRIPLMQLAFRIIKDNPVLGVGANNSAIVMEQYATAELSGEWLYGVHNKYLLVWTETGIGGLIAFTAFLLVTLRQ
ncbi:MAG: O-antigen ligase family protein, partial [Candidatus Tectomicrobia bacterium]|nr:O-antigen ligase family protein [Candidatus Tectomicrobia bacterium]